MYVPLTPARMEARVIPHIMDTITPASVLWDIQDRIVRGLWILVPLWSAAMKGHVFKIHNLLGSGCTMAQRHTVSARVIIWESCK